MPGRVTCHFCVCLTVPVEKALTILMLLISQHLTLVFSFPCFGMRLRKTLGVCVCVCVCTPSHLVTSDAAAGSRHCQENPRLAGIPNAYTHTHTCLYTLTHAFIHTRELCISTLQPCAWLHLNTVCMTHMPLPFHTLVLKNPFSIILLPASITVAVKPTLQRPHSNVNSRTCM